MFKPVKFTNTKRTD